MKRGSEFQVALEAIDDVSFDANGGDIADVLQTKHHLNTAASLSDASPDLWKTLRVWFTGRSRGDIPPSANLFIITTATAPVDSAASHLRAEPRDVATAQERLDAVASSSTNQANSAAYQAYVSAPADHRAATLSQITVVDAAPDIVDLEAELLKEIFWAVARQHETPFLTRLEGWWARRVVQQLVGGTTSRIGSVEIDSFMADLREQFKRDALPIDEDLIGALDEATVALYTDYRFVRQLEIIKLGSRRVSFAIQDYYKAFTQRSRWLREDLVADFDLRKYEARLIDEWSRVFEEMRDEIGEAATDEVKERAAKAVLKWADSAVILIRPAVTEPFVSRGSFHILADDLRIGWHPDFHDRLATILGATK
jgi:hypothetical protein